MNISKKIPLDLGLFFNPNVPRLVLLHMSLGFSAIFADTGFEHDL